MILTKEQCDKEMQNLKHMSGISGNSQSLRQGLLEDFIETIDDLESHLRAATDANQSVINAFTRRANEAETKLKAATEKSDCGHPKMFSKYVMRLPKYAAYPNFVETHIEDDWCVKARCEPVYVCGCAGIHREDRPAHSNQRLMACTLCASIAAAYERGKMDVIDYAHWTKREMEELLALKDRGAKGGRG